MNLKKGYQEFFEKYFRQRPEVYKQLVKSQSPEVLFLACCDSRIDPAIITSAEPGELFVVRNIANYVPNFVSRSLESEAMTAIEFAVCQLRVSSLIVLGHQCCAGVKAIVEADDKESMPIVWQEQHDRLCSVVQKKYSEETSQQFEKENIKLACHDLLTYPFIKERVLVGKLSVSGWYFSLETGSVQVYDPKKEEFNILFS